MSRSGVCVVVILAGLVCATAVAASGEGRIVCPGSYGGHLQGIATDDSGAIYWSFTRDLVKTDSSGKVLAKKPVPNHHGDLAWHDGRIYVAVNLGEFNKEAGRADSWVYVYDAGDLDLLAKHAVPEVVHGAGGIDCHDGTFYVVGGLPEGHDANYVYEYDRGFRFVDRHVIESGYTLMGIQTACHADGCWWFGCYGEPPCLLRTDESFRLLGRHEFDCALGVCRSSGGELLIGRPVGDSNRRGQAFPARPDETRGPAIMDDAPAGGVGAARGCSGTDRRGGPAGSRPAAR